jgi:hypothetical protein
MFPAPRQRPPLDVGEEAEVNTMLENSHDFRAFRRDMESRLMQLESEISRMKWKQTIDATERSMTFWFGAIFFTGLLLVIVFARDWT